MNNKIIIFRLEVNQYNYDALATPLIQNEFPWKAVLSAKSSVA